MTTATWTDAEFKAVKSVFELLPPPDIRRMVRVQTGMRDGGVPFETLWWETEHG